MTNREDSTYDMLFKYISNKLGDYQPTSMMSVFEIAPRNSFATWFPTSNQRGCFFHFMQSLWRRIQKNAEIMAVYKASTYFAFHLRYLAALAFVPVDEVVISFENILQMTFFVQNKDKLAPFVLYFEKNWIGERFGTRRRAPRFPISLWNVNAGVTEQWGKTNNSCEGFNHGFSCLLAAHHPTIWNFIKGLQKQQTLTEIGSKS